jgi:hypothetical protein
MKAVASGGSVERREQGDPGLFAAAGSGTGRTVFEAFGHGTCPS